MTDFYTAGLNSSDVIMALVDEPARELLQGLLGGPYEP